MLSHLSIREAIILSCQTFNSSGLSVGKSGNISVRSDRGFLITPGQIPYDEMTPSMIVDMSLEGRPDSDHVRSSVEWRFHRDIYRARPDIGAIVHAHPRNCTALACTGRSIPPFHYMVAVAGGRNIPLAEYALFGTEELSRNMVAVLHNRNACLIAHHGMIALGDDLTSAFNLAIEVENLASQFVTALNIGNVKYLEKEDMDEVIENFRRYTGPKAKT